MRLRSPAAREFVEMKHQTHSHKEQDHCVETSGYGCGGRIKRLLGHVAIMHECVMMQWDTLSPPPFPRAPLSCVEHAQMSKLAKKCASTVFTRLHGSLGRRAQRAVGLGHACACCRGGGGGLCKLASLGVYEGKQMVKWRDMQEKRQSCI